MNTQPLLFLFSLFIATGGLVASPAKPASALPNGTTLALFPAPPSRAWPWGGEGRWTGGGAKLYPERWLGLLGVPGPEPAQDGEQSRAKQSATASGADAWMYGAVAFVLVLAVAHAALCCSWGRPTREEQLATSGEHPWGKKEQPPGGPGAAEVRRPRLPDLAPRAKKLSRPGSPASPGSSGLLSAAADGAADATPPPALPESCRFQCALYIPRLVCHRRQNLTVSINRLAMPGGTALYKAHVAEGDSADTSGAGIHLEMLGAAQEFTFLSTDDVWASQGKRQPEMEIARASGAKYATMKKTDPSTYTMARGTDALMVFSGHFSRHELQVRSATGQTLARVSPGSIGDKYEAVVYTSTDVSLVILGLLAIDKVEVSPS